jgi:hypothetical protein
MTSTIESAEKHLGDGYALGVIVLVAALSAEVTCADVVNIESVAFAEGVVLVCFGAACVARPFSWCDLVSGL